MSSSSLQDFPPSDLNCSFQNKEGVTIGNLGWSLSEEVSSIFFPSGTFHVSRWTLEIAWKGRITHSVPTFLYWQTVSAPVTCQDWSWEQEGADVSKKWRLLARKSSVNYYDTVFHLFVSQDPKTLEWKTWFSPATRFQKIFLGKEPFYKWSLI